MPAIIPAIAGLASAATAGIAAANKSGQVDPEKLPQQYQTDPNAYRYGGEGLEFWRQGLNQQAVRDDATIARQNALVAQLEQAAAGKGASAAQAQLNEGRDQAVKTAMAVTGAARGSGLGAAQIGASNAGAEIVGRSANDAARLKAQEMQSAQLALGNVLGGMRGAYGQEEARRAQMEQFYMSLGQSREEAALNARIHMEKANLAAAEGWADRRTGAMRHNAETEGRYVAGVGKAFSDMGAQYASMGGGGDKG